MQVRTKVAPVWSSEEITYLREFFVAVLPSAASVNGISPENAVAGAMTLASLAVKAFMGEKAKIQT